MDDFGIIDTFYNTFNGLINGGFVRVEPAVNYLLGALITLTVVLAAITMWVWADAEAIIKGLFLKILLIGFFTYIIQDWQGLTTKIIGGLTQLGVTAGGAASGVDANTLNAQPRAIIGIGFDLFQGMAQTISPLLEGWGILDNFFTIAVYGFCGFIVMAAFGVMAGQVFIAVLEYKIITLAAFIFIPFGLWQRTNFLSERALGYVFAAGIKMLVLALIISITTTTFVSIVVNSEPSFANALSLAVASMILMALSLSAPSLAAALISGGPQTGIGSLLAGAAGGVAAAAAPAVGAAAGYGAARSIAQGAVNRYRAAAAAGGEAGETGGRASQGLAAARGAMFPSSVATNPAGGQGSAGAGAGGSSSAPSAGAAPGNTPPGGWSDTGGGDTGGTAASGAGGGAAQPREGKWYSQSGGVAGLSPKQRAAAEAAYETWGADRDQAFSFGSYVDYVQTKTAEARAGTQSADGQGASQSSPLSTINTARNAASAASQDAGPGITSTASTQSQGDE